MNGAANSCATSPCPAVCVPVTIPPFYQCNCPPSQFWDMNARACEQECPPDSFNDGSRLGCKACQVCPTNEQESAPCTPTSDRQCIARKPNQEHSMACETTPLMTKDALFGFPPKLNSPLQLSCSGCPPPAGTTLSVWGSRWYTVDSDFCQAALHTTALNQGKFLVEFKTDVLNQPRTALMGVESATVTTVDGNVQYMSQTWPAPYPVIFRITAVWNPVTQNFDTVAPGGGPQNVLFLPVSQHQHARLSSSSK